MNQNNYNLLSRFSCTLLGNGKKVSGHKTFLESLFLLKFHNEKPLLSFNHLPNYDKNLVSFLISRGFPLEVLEKAQPENKPISNLLNQSNLENAKLTANNKKLCEKCRDNVKPILEIRKVRKGRVVYRVPLVTQINRQEGKAIAWLVESAYSRKIKTKLALQSNVNRLLIKFVEDKKKSYRSLKNCLSEEISDSLKGKGETIEKKEELHQLALRNRAYTHFRWW